MASQASTQSHRRIWILGMALFLVIGGITGLYFAFQYTYVADIREAVIQPDVNDSVAYGETLFETRGCIACHSLDKAGSDGDTGPNLTNIAERHDEDYIRESIQNPNAVIADQCPEEACEADIMPDYDSILDADQIDALIIYLMTP